MEWDELTEDEPGSELGLMFSRVESFLLQDGTSHIWEEGLHLTGACVHLMLSASAFNGSLILSQNRRACVSIAILYFSYSLIES